ncbi:MAG: thioredoxin family protein [Planctomycetota bacterium]
MASPRLSASGSVSLLAALLLNGCSDRTSAATEADLASALASAGTSSKVVFVDFGAEWCGPCKRLALTTLADPGVDEWLRKHAIFLRVDIDQSPALAKEFRVDSVPTMLFLRPDRTELGRITGYVDAAKFLRDAEDRLRGISSLDQARKAAAEAPNDCMKQFELMQEARRASQYDDALAAAAVYWRKSRTDMAQAGVRLSFFVSEMARLADAHAPAQARGQEWMAAARDQLVAGKNLTQAANELAALARELHQPLAVLDAADALTAKGDEARRALRALAAAATKELVADRRYALVVDGGACEPKAVKGRLAMMRGMASRTGAKNPESESNLRRFAAEEALPAFEALIGVGRIDDALAIAEVALADADRDLRELFGSAARRAGHAELVDRLPR